MLLELDRNGRRPMSDRRRQSSARYAGASPPSDPTWHDIVSSRSGKAGCKPANCHTLLLTFSLLTVSTAFADVRPTTLNNLYYHYITAATIATAAAAAAATTTTTTTTSTTDTDTFMLPFNSLNHCRKIQ